MTYRTTIFFALLLFGGFSFAMPTRLSGQQFEPNYDESKIPPFELPLLIDSQHKQMLAEGISFETAWSMRREELLSIFREQMYGHAPQTPFDVHCDLVESGPCLDGKALRQQFIVRISTDVSEQTIELVVWTPAGSTNAVPGFVGLNFGGNHTTTQDPAVRISNSWKRGDPTDNQPKSEPAPPRDVQRGTSASRWPIELIVEAGMGVATAYYGDIDPDFDDGFQNGVHRLFPAHRPSAEAKNRWGSIAAWAWGLSRILDAIEQSIPQLAPDQMTVFGHSRLGKTALWAGATDTRFARVISNNSGCGGAALSRRAIGETVWRINDSFPHWFCGNFKKYSNQEAQLPIDQHQLIAAIAPRPVYIASASEDLWADPKGEFLAAQYASPIYENLGKDALKMKAFPNPGAHSIGDVSYHLRQGKHDVTQWDWERFIEFARNSKNSE